MARLIHFFPDADLRSGHLGLSRMLSKAGISPSEINHGDFVLFLNRSQTAFKVFTSGNLIAHYKSHKGTVDIDAIHYLPLAFSKNGFDFHRSIKASLLKKFERRGIRVKT